MDIQNRIWIAGGRFLAYCNNHKKYPPLQPPTPYPKADEVTLRVQELHLMLDLKTWHYIKLLLKISILLPVLPVVFYGYYQLSLYLCLPVSLSLQDIVEIYPQ